MQKTATRVSLGWTGILSFRSLMILAFFFLLSALGIMRAQSVTDTLTLPAGTWRAPMVVNPVTNKIYVGNYYAGTVTVIDGATNIQTPISVGTNPRAVDVNPETNRIYVANWGSNTVTVINGATNTTIGNPISVGSEPAALAVNPTTNTIYVANFNDGTVTVIDGANNTTIGVITVGTNPYAVGVNPVTNTIYVANNGSGNVSVINGSTNSTIGGPLSAGSGPLRVAVNPVTNKIYVANWDSGTVTVINGATNTTAAQLTVGTHPSSVEVNPVTNKIYVVNNGSNSVTVIDGGTNVMTPVTVGNGPYFTAVNPATNQIYVTNVASNTVTVLAGATNTVAATVAATLPVGEAPWTVVVNPVTNKIYVNNSIDNPYVSGIVSTVTVIDGAVNSTTSVSAGTAPFGVAVNSASNKIYVTNNTADTVTVIDGATNLPTTVNAGTGPYGVAVNPLTNKAYVTNYGGNTVTVIDGVTNEASTVVVGTNPHGVAVNPVTNQIYVTNYGTESNPGNTVTVIDGDTSATSTVAVGTGPSEVAVNPVTNQIYVTNYGTTSNPGNTVTVINGSTNTTSTITVGTGPRGVAVNPVTNKIYVGNWGASYGGTNTVSVIYGGTNAVTNTLNAANGPGGIQIDSVTNKIYMPDYVHNLTVIDGATNAVSSVAVGVSADYLAVNPVTNKIYVSNFNDNTVTVVDGATNSTSTISVGTEPRWLDVNTATGVVYVADWGGASVTVLTPNALQSIPLTAQVTGDPDSQTVPGFAIFATTNLTPSFTAAITDSYSPITPPPTGLYYQLDTAQGQWLAAAPLSSCAGCNWPGYTFELSNVAAGLHTIYAYAVDGDETGSNSAGVNGYSPVIGQLTAYTFVEQVPPVLPPSPILTLNCPEVTYDGNPHGCTGTATGVDGVDVPGTWVITYNGSTTPPTNAGTYNAVGTFTSTYPNYASGGTAPGTLKISPATASVTPNAASKIYGTSDPTLTGTLTGFLASDTISATYTRVAGETVAGSPYTISATLRPAGVLGNYNITYNTAGFTINPATPVITWPTPAAITYGTPLSGTQLNATASVPGTFSYVPQAGTVLSAGQQKLWAIFTPNDTTNYTTATASVPLTVNQATPSLALSCAPSPAVYGSSVVCTAQLPGDATGTVQFEDSGVNLGTAVSVAGGSAAYSTSNLALGAHSITAVYSGDTNYTGITSSSFALNIVLPPTATLLWSWRNPSLYDQSGNVTAQVWAPGNPTGTVTFTDSGTQLGSATLATSASVTNLLLYSSQFDQAPWTAASAIGVTADYTSSPVGDETGYRLTAASGTWENGTCPGLQQNITVPPLSTDLTFSIWLKSNTGANQTIQIWLGWPSYGSAFDVICPVSSNWQRCSITSPTPNGSQAMYASVVPCTKSGDPATDVSIWGAQVEETFFGGFPGPYIATGSTSATGTAIVAAYNMETLDAGTHTLVATYAGDANYAGSTSAALTQIIQQGITHVTLMSSANPSAYGMPVTFTVWTFGGETGTVTFSDGSTTLGTANVSGSVASLTVPGLSVGTHSITATYSSNNPNYAGGTSAPLTQTVNQAVSAVTLTCGPSPALYGVSIACTAQVPTNATGTVQFQVDGVNSGAPVAVSAGAAADGFAQLSAGTHSIAAVYSGDTNYLPATSLSFSETVNQATPTVTWAPPAAITYGTPLSAAQLNATASVAGTFSYNPLAGTVLGAGKQPLSVTFTPTDTTDYTTATASVSLMVNQATPVITWPTPAPITYGTPLSATQLNATASVAGTFSYNPLAGTVLSAGKQPLTVTFTPTDTTDYTTATASVSLTVNQATPVITWPTPAPITYGTPLSATQLNATASVAGNFSYNPLAGTVLSAGMQTLSVTFTPTDTTDYTTTTASVPLTITIAPTLTLSCPEVNYDGNPHGCTGTATGVGGVTVNGTWTITYDGMTTVPVDALNWPVAGTFTSGDPNYSSGTITSRLKIDAIPAALTLSCPEMAYDGTPHSCTGMAVGLKAATLNWSSWLYTYIGSGSTTYGPSSTAPTNAGTYSVTGTFTSGAQDYYVSQPPASGTLIIDKTNRSPATTVGVGTYPWAVAVNPVTNKTYVVDSNSNNVTVIDGATNTTTTVSVGLRPMAVAVNAVTNKIYVSNSGANTMTVIDGATNATSTVKNLSGAAAVAVNPVTNKIYVANSGNGTVAVIDGGTNVATTVSTGGLESGPDAVAVNVVTNKIYVANGSNDTVTVIDGATNATTTVSVGSSCPQSVAVNPVTNKIYVTGPCSTTTIVTVIDGATNATSTAYVGADPGWLAVNPVTNKIYVASYNTWSVIDGATNASTVYAWNNSGGAGAVAVNSVTNKIYLANIGGTSVTVVDGATNANSTVSVGNKPWDVAVNPVTNKIYVANLNDNTVTVIDGTANSTTTVSTGSNPSAVAVGSVANKTYVANSGSNTVTVVDGVTNSTSTVGVGITPTAVAVNPVMSKTYVANSGDNTVTVIDGATNNTTTTVSVGNSPKAVAVNPVTNQMYVANSGSNTVTVIDGATNNTTTVSVGNSPWAVAVNPVTNQIYVANQGDGTVTVINGATNSTTPVGVGSNPWAVAVNPVTNQIYVANEGDGTMTVINGATNATTTVSVGSNPWAVTANPVTNQIYVANKGDGTMTVIDGATNVTTIVSVGSNPWAVVVNPVTNQVYVANNGEGTVTVISPNTVQSIPLSAQVAGVADSQTITGLAVFGTKNPNPSFTATATSSYSPIAPAPTALYYQLDTVQGAWQRVTASGGAGSNPAGYNFSLSGVAVGLHTLYAFAVYGDESGTDNAPGNSPEIGNMTAYTFVEVPVQSSQTITFPNPGTQVYGVAPITLTATASSGLTVSYTVTSGPATVSGSALTITGAGAVIVQATQAGNSSYFAAPPVSISFTVEPATPVITWPTPAAIPYGTPLSATQLDATASVPGGFSYSPLTGTVLSAESQTLSVIFTPTDTTDYTTATASVSLTVNPAAPTLTLSCAEVTYDGSAHGCTGAATGVGGVAVNGTWAFSPATGTVAGIYSVTGTFTSTDPNYASGGTASGTLIIDKANQSPTAACASPVSYDGQAHGCTLTGGIGACPSSTVTDVPGGAITLSCAGDANHNAWSDNTDYYVVITPATPVLAISCNSVTYNNAPRDCSPGGIATGIGGVTVPGTWVYTYSGSTTPPTNTGTYTVVGTFASSNADYTGGTAGATFTITPPAKVIPYMTSQAASAYQAEDVVVDRDGNMYVGTSGQVLKIDAVTGMTTVFAGGGTRGVSCPTPDPSVNGSGDAFGDGCPANYATLSDLRGIAIDATYLYVSDENTSVISRIGLSANALSGQLYVHELERIWRGGNPHGIAVDKHGNVFWGSGSGTAAMLLMADVSTNPPTIRTVVNQPAPGYGAVPGCQTDPNLTVTPASSATLFGVNGLTFDQDGNLYFVDKGCYSVRKITPNPQTGIVDGTGTFSTLIGNGSKGTYQGPWYNTLGTPAFIGTLRSVAVASRGFNPTANNLVSTSNDLYISTTNGLWFYDAQTGWAHQIMKTAGDGNLGCSSNSRAPYTGCPAPLANFSASGDGGRMSTDQYGNLYVADNGNRQVTKLAAGTDFVGIAPAAAVALGGSASQVALVHVPGNCTTPGPTLPAPFVIGSLSSTCYSGNANSDQGADWLVPLTYTPTALGMQSGDISFNGSMLPLDGQGGVPITVTLNSPNKVYDGTPNVTVTSCSFSGLASQDQGSMGCSATATFASVNVGTGISVTPGHIQLTGPAAGKYGVLSASATPAAITPAPIYPYVNYVEKAYDGSNQLLTSCVPGGMLPGDSLNCAATVIYPSPNVFEGIATVTNFVLSGGSVGNYTLAYASTQTDALIYPRQVIASVTAANKLYDGTTTATITSCTVSGELTQDQGGIGCTASGQFASAAPGNGITVTAYPSLTGAMRGNYQLSGGWNSSVTTTANITTQH